MLQCDNLAALKTVFSGPLLTVMWVFCDGNTVMFLFKVLIATSTLAWGVNFPAHLVIVKGTEYYDGKTHRYVDYPITGSDCANWGINPLYMHIAVCHVYLFLQMYFR